MPDQKLSMCWLKSMDIDNNNINDFEKSILIFFAASQLTYHSFHFFVIRFIIPCNM